MNRDELKGKAEKAKGYVKEEAGEILNDPELEAEGKAERAGGKLREGFGMQFQMVCAAADRFVFYADDAACFVWRRGRAPRGPAHPTRARSSFRRIFPMGLFGSASTNRTCFGHLNFASRA